MPDSSETAIAAATAARNPDRVVIDLTTPIQRGETQIASFYLKKPKGAALYGFNLPDIIDLNAERAAKSSLAKRQRSKSTFDYDLAVADCTLRPNLGITLSGWPAIVSGQKWLVNSVETEMAAGGISQKVNFEAG